MDPTDASTVSIATRTTTSYALTFASWKETEKWDGRLMGKKAFKEKFERAIRREPEMMAMWTGWFNEYTAANFAKIQHTGMRQLHHVRTRIGGVQGGQGNRLKGSVSGELLVG